MLVHDELGTVGVQEPVEASARQGPDPQPRLARFSFVSTGTPGTDLLRLSGVQPVREDPEEHLQIGNRSERGGERETRDRRVRLDLQAVR